MKSSGDKQTASTSTPYRNTSLTMKGENAFFSGINSFFASQANSSLFIQPKLTVGQPNDKYEKEADAMADKVVNQARHDSLRTSPITNSSMIPSVLTKCAECEQEEKLQTKGESWDYSTALPTVEASLNSSMGNGSPLPLNTRMQMENSIGADFSGVRLHTDSAAVQMNMDLHSQAFTHGSDIYFNSGKYDTNSVGGKHLLAHELSHTVQQGAALQLHRQPSLNKIDRSVGHQIAPAIQRSMGFEFQTKNIITTNQGRKFPRKFGGAFHKGQTGVEMQTDTGSVVEFETRPFRKWSDLRAQIEEAASISQAINGTFGKGFNFAWNDVARKSQMFAFSEEKRLQKDLRKGETLKVDVKDPNFVAAIQSSEGLALSQYESLLREHEDPDFIKPVIGDAKSILDSAMKANSKIKTNTDNLRGLLLAIVNYLTRGQEVLSSSEKVSPVKARFRLMHRTSFSSMFNSLLTKDEKALFTHIIKNNVIPDALNLDKDAPIFPEGYWGHVGNMMGLFKDGKVVALSTEDKKVIHDCTSKTKAPLNINASKCGMSVPKSNITVGQWLSSIISQQQDLLSPPHEGGGSMGKLDVSKNKSDEKNLAIFETRGYRGRDRTRPVNEWVDFAEEIFQHAAVCRKRPGSGTELEYDGTNIFTYGQCIMHDKIEAGKK